MIWRDLRQIQGVPKGDGIRWWSGFEQPGIPVVDNRSLGYSEKSYPAGMRCCEIPVDSSPRMDGEPHMLRARRLMGWMMLIVFVSGCAYRPSALPNMDPDAVPDENGDLVEVGSKVRVTLHDGEVLTGVVERISRTELVLAEVSWDDRDQVLDEGVIPVESIESIKRWKAQSTGLIVVAVVGLAAIVGFFVVLGNALSDPMF